MGNPGYIYALINPALEGLVKVGKTTTNPDKRANELSSATGVPMQFMVAHSVCIADCDLGEKYAHGILEKKGFRVSSNREFFQAPLQEAINAIKSTADFIGIASEKELSASKVKQVAKVQSNSADWADLVREADKYMKTPNCDLDVDKALDMYRKAAEKGCVRAYYEQGFIHLFEAQGIGRIPIQFERFTIFQKLFGNDNALNGYRQGHAGKGLECHRIALKHGYELSYAALASYFGETNNTAEAKRHWDLFFQSNIFRQRNERQRGRRNESSDFVTNYKNFLAENLKMDWEEAEYHANQKFDV